MLFILKTVKRPDYWTGDPVDTEVVFMYPYGDTLPRPVEIESAVFADRILPILPDDCKVSFLCGNDEFSTALSHEENDELLDLVKETLEVLGEEAWEVNGMVGF